ncbi:MAG: glycine--tRNA ligase subunit beta, partial [Desulfobacterales bacterium]
ESDDVAAAIEEHYRPVYSGGPLPQSMLGSLLAIADKLDTLCGCFSAGLIPTGGSDPYALRRQSIGIILMLRNLGLSFSLSDIVGAGLKPFAAVAAEPMEDISSRLLSFLRDRISHLLVEEGKAKDTVLAVVSVSSDQVPQVWEKVTALEALRGDEGFDPLAVAFKRVANIIRKARQDFPDLDLPDIDTALFEDASETALWRAFQRVESSVDRLLSENKFDEALSTMATLREPVDAFFEGVMVMADNQGLRRNRLAILARIAALFETIADFSKLSV